MSAVRLAVHATGADPDVIEICAGAGACGYFVDLEHGAADLAESVQAIRVAQGAGIEAHFRLPLSELHLASRLVDAGANGIHFADVRRAADVAACAGALFHPPVGRRGYGGCRRNGYGAPLTPVSQPEPLLGVQIESREGVDNLDEILASPHVGLVAVGSRDLAADLGHGGVLEHPEVEWMVDLVSSKVRASKVDLALMARSRSGCSAATARGASLVLVPLAALLREALAGYLSV